MLEQERARLKNVLDGTQAGTWKWNVQTGETDFNKRWAEMMGYTLDELSPFSIETWKKLTHPEDLLMSTELLEKHFKGELAYYECRLRMKHKNGAWVWVLDKGRVAEWTDDGKPLWMYGTQQDITSQVRAEESLKNSEIQLSNALQMAKAGHWEYDVESDTFTFNDNFYRIFRTTADEVGGYTMSSAEYARRFLHTEDAHMVAEENRRALETDDPSYNRTIEHRINYSDGETGHILVRYFIEKDGAGKTIRTFGVNQDITERKNMECALEEREQIFRRVFTESPVGKELYNPDGLLVELNKTCLDIFGVSDPEQVKGFNLFEDPNIPVTAKESLTKGQAVSYNYNFDFSEVRRLELYDTSGTGKLLIHADITPLGCDGQRASGGYLVQVRDVTEHRQLEQEREATLTILRLLNATNNRQELMESVILYLRDWTGCEAVGIRIKEGEDFPYYVTAGFSNEFVLAEKFLCEIDGHGRIVRDGQSNPVLDCMCGNIIRGRFDPELPFFTDHGSFWTNSTTELLASTSEKDRQARTRNRCNGEGYESVALVPIRFGKETFGLLQINDRRKNVFTQRMIDILERLADNLAIGMAQRASVARLRDSNERLSLATRAAGIGIWDWDVLRNELKWDDSMYLLYGIEKDEFKGAYEAWIKCLHPKI